MICWHFFSRQCFYFTPGANKYFGIVVGHSISSEKISSEHCYSINVIESTNADLCGLWNTAFLICIQLLLKIQLSPLLFWDMESFPVYWEIYLMDVKNVMVFSNSRIFLLDELQRSLSGHRRSMQNLLLKKFHIFPVTFHWDQSISYLCEHLSTFKVCCPI